MRELIYYPGFEVKNPDWLKFALLYLDKLDPIIPCSGDNHLSDQHKQLMSETDLISIHRPSYKEGDDATLDALDEVEKILRHPDRYANVFQKSYIIDEWKRPKNQIWTLFKGKYTGSWERFCLENNLGLKSDSGMLVAKELALLYMTILAQAIAESRDLSPITDHRSLDRFSVFIRKAKPNDTKVWTIAQEVLELKLPANISEISIEKVIRHRNQPGFKERQKAFHDELEQFIVKVKSEDIPKDFANSLGSAWSEFNNDILQIGIGAAIVGLGVWRLVQPQGVNVASVSETIAGGVSLIGSSVAIRKNWRHTETKRYTRKYLADLTKLKPEIIV